MPKKSVWETYRDQVINKEIKTLDQLATLYEQARQYYQQGEWLEVLDIFVRIKTIKPDYPDPEKLLSSTEKAIAEQEKQAELEILYISAQEAIFNGQWGEAQRLLRKITKEEPEFKDVSQLSHYVDSSLEAKRLAIQKKKDEKMAEQQAATLVEVKPPEVSRAQNEKRLFQQWLGILAGIGLLGLMAWVFFATIPYWSGYFKTTKTPTLVSTVAAPIAEVATSIPFTPSSENTKPPTAMPTSLPSITSIPTTSVPTFTTIPSSTFTPIPTLTSTVTEAPSPTLNATPGLGSIKISPKDGMPMVYVPEGEFFMGAEQRSIYVSDYWIDRTEVTNAMFAQCVDDGSCTYPKSKDYGVSLYADYPVIWVSWFQAEAYCQWAGRRLPTDAEWEKAARGTDGRRYPWGITPLAGNLLNFCDNNCTYDWKAINTDDGFTNLAPVGSFPDGAGPYGTYDMAGNVLEWVADWYQKIIPANAPTRNPIGPAIGTMRVLKGGSYNNTEFFARVYTRSGNDPALTYGNVGFRCALSP